MQQHDSYYELTRGYGRSTYYLGTRVVFGEGSVDQLGELVDFSERVLVVTGRGSAQSHGHLDRVLDSLREKTSVTVSATVSPNPRLEEVEAAAAMGLESGAEAVIGLGGGSAMDAAKGVAVAIALGGKVTSLFREGKPAPADTLPVVCVPTTAGTGSETSKGAILTDSEQGIKNGLRGEALLPRLAVVDPTLTYSVPLHISMETGFDVLTHAVETWVSRKATPFVELNSRHAIEVVFHWLPRLFEDLADVDARRELSFASLLMGFNLANSSTCLPHRMQYPIGALTDTSHPAGLAALYPAWCAQTWQAAPKIFDYLSRFCGGDACQPESVSEGMAQFLHRIGLVRGLKDLGVAAEALSGLAEAVSGDLAVDPGFSGQETLHALYRRAWERGIS